MPRKDLRKKLSSEPQLLYYYKRAMKAVYNIYVRVADNKHEGFISKEKELLVMGITPKDYSYGVAVMLEKWVADKGMNTVPVNVFLGKWILDKYLKVHNSLTVTISDVGSDGDVDLLVSELLVARSYIQANLINGKKFRDVVTELEPLLSKEWLRKYEDGTRLHIETLALMQLEDEYLVKSANSYNDIIDALVLSGHT